MRGRWVAAIIAVSLALANAAWAQSPRDTYVRQQQQDRFLRAVEQLNNSQILFLYPRGSGFTNFLKSSASSPSRAAVRLCDRLSGALHQQYLSTIGVSREQWSESFRQMLGNLFKVPIVSVDASKCDIRSLSDADAVVVVGTQAKNLFNDLARDGRLMDSQNLPSIDFYRIGDTVEIISNSIVEAARTVAEDRRRREIEEDARRKAELAEAAQRTMLELEHRARAGDHAAALKGQELARNAGNRSKENDFRILSAETGPSALKLEVATDLTNGRNGFPTEPDKARRFLEQAVAAGHGPSMVALASMESSPSLYSEDNRRAYELLEKAAALGDPSAGEKLKQLRERVSQNEWARTEKRIMEFAPWAGLALVLGVAGFVAYLRRDDIGLSLKRLKQAHQHSTNQTALQSITDGGRTAPKRADWIVAAAAIGVLVVSLGIYNKSWIPDFGSSVPNTHSQQRRSPVYLSNGDFDTGACMERCHNVFDQCDPGRPVMNSGLNECTLFGNRGSCIQRCSKIAICQKMPSPLPPECSGEALNRAANEYLRR